MILVTGAGGAAGVAVIRVLRARNEPVVAVDADPLAAGLALADDHAVVRFARNEGFLSDLCEAVKRLGADVVLCTVSEEMLAIAGHEAELVRAGAAIWLSPRDAIETSVDKWAFACALERAGITTPATAIGRDVAGIRGPWIVKPRFGRGSRDVYAVDARDDLEAVLRRVDEPIVQTRACGREFTVDVVIDRDGAVRGAIPRWRLETKAGISTRGRTFADGAVVEAATATVTALRLQAAVNVQGFEHDGRVSIIEVNPRVSGGLSLTQAAGADVVGELVRGTRGESVRAEALSFEPGVTMQRYFTEVFS